jgi:hypothetical protein
MELAYGQTESMLKYFQNKISESPSFQCSLQLDCEDLDSLLISVLHSRIKSGRLICN